jgi:hypothetical protein
MKTPTYALRLETMSNKIELQISKHMIKFLIRLLNMPESRIAKLSYMALISTADSDVKKYNWTLYLKDILARHGMMHLWKCHEASSFLIEKKTLFQAIQQTLIQEDLERANNSDRFKYCCLLEDDHRLKDLLGLGLPIARISAQLRLNEGAFYRKKEVFKLNKDW